MRLFTVMLPRPTKVYGNGFRSRFTFRAEEPADAERLYWQECPDGPMPSFIVEIEGK